MHLWPTFMSHRDMQSNSRADVIGVCCLGFYGKLLSMHVYVMISLYPMESLDLSSRYLLLCLSLRNYPKPTLNIWCHTPRLVNNATDLPPDRRAFSPLNFMHFTLRYVYAVKLYCELDSNLCFWHRKLTSQHVSNAIIKSHGITDLSSRDLRRPVCPEPWLIGDFWGL